MSRLRLFAAAVAIFSGVGGGVRAVAQDRVILFYPSVARSFAQPAMPGAIREIEITNGGRGWSVVRSVELPAHVAGQPVALADGRRILWLASDQAGSSLLVQYDVVSARASIVDIGRFAADAVLAVDPSAVDVFVVEPNRVVFIDERLQPYVLDLPGPKRLMLPVAGEGILVLRRSLPQGREPELVVINSQTRTVSRIVPVRFEPGVRWVVISPDAQRLYQTYTVYENGVHYRLGVTSLATGELLARTVSREPQYILQLDVSRGAIVSDQRDSNGFVTFAARDARTLAPLGEFGHGAFQYRKNFTLTQTAREGAILVFSLLYRSYFGGSCATEAPRITVFDGRTFGVVNEIDLQGRCPFMVPLPPRR